MCGTLGATRAWKDGVDRAVIGLRLGHHQLSSTDNYVVLDPQSIGEDLGHEQVAFGAVAIARLSGYSERHSQRLHLATGGNPLALTRLLEGR
jgi:predicted HD phosphohydrolase